LTNLVLIHGAGGDRHELKPLAEAIGPELTCFSFDMLGHNGRPEPDNYGVQEIAEDLMAGLDAAGVGQAFFFGYSFGGIIAYYLAHHFPERVLGACALGARIRYDENTVRHLLHILDPARAERLGIVVPPWVAAIHAKHRMLLSTVGERGGAGLVEERLPFITRPVLALNGNADPLVSVEDTMRVGELVPKSRCAIYEGSAHPFRSVPTWVVAKLVLQFIRDVEAGEFDGKPAPVSAKVTFERT